jgi:neurotransmitter:Na+ symporter, NSS family
MQPFRHRWQNRIGVMVAVAGIGTGMLLCRPDVLQPHGIGLLTWLLALFVVVIPMAVLELGTGAIYQDSLSESCRKAGKNWEFVGWMAAAGALLAVLVLAQLGGQLASAFFDSLLAAVADQPGKWVAHANEITAPHADGRVLGLLVLLGVLTMRIWRGAPGIGSTAVVMTVFAGAGLLLVGGSMVFYPGALDGLVTMLLPDTATFFGVGSADVWSSIGIMILIGWAYGTGALTAYGSYLNRSTDAIGIGAVAVLVGAIGQLLLVVVLAIGGGVIVASTPDQASALPAAIDRVAQVLANGGLPSWWAGILLALWFLTILAVLIPAFMAMAEAVIAPLVDKFRLPRERVVPAVMIGVFFVVTAMSEQKKLNTWCQDALVWLLLLTVALQSFCAVHAIRLDAVARHLNAYSAFRLRRGWQIAVAGVIPFVAIVTLMFWVWHGGEKIIPGGAVAAGAIVIAVIIARLSGRSL